MARKIDKQNLDRTISLPDLPPEIIKIILQGLTDEEVYFKVRKVSRRLQVLSDDVVE